jgi:hypothetical protein
MRVGICGLTDVFVGQLVGQAHTLRLMLDGTTVNNGVLELFDDGFVDGIALVKCKQI